MQNLTYISPIKLLFLFLLLLIIMLVMIVFNNNNNNNSVFHILYEEYRQCFIINASVGQLALLLVMICKYGLM